MEARPRPHPPIPPLFPHHHHHHHHHRLPLPHFHLPLFLLCPCSNPHLLLIPHHHHQPHCRLPFVPTTSNLSCPNFSPIPPTGSSAQPLQKLCPMPVRPDGVGSLAVSETKEMDASACGLQQHEWRDDQELEDEEDVFVMTDEWMDFFAKSEAKRRLAKQQKKKGCY